VLVDPEVIKFFNSEMALVKIDAEKDTLTAQEYHVSGYPTLVMVNPDGVEIDRLVGYLPPKEFLETFRNYSKGIGTLDDLLSRADTSEDRALYAEIAEKYKYRGGDEEATRWYNKVIDSGDPLDSLSGESRLALADMYRRAHEWDTALNAYQAITKDFGDSPFGADAEIWTAIVYRQSGDTASAVKQFQSFIDNHPDNPDTAYCKRQIERLTKPPEEEKSSEG